MDGPSPSLTLKPSEELPEDWFWTDEDILATVQGQISRATRESLGIRIAQDRMEQ